MKLHHAPALVACCLLVPAVLLAQPQAQIRAFHANNTLEIPIVVPANESPLDPTFVGVWCGEQQFEHYDEAPPVGAEPPGIRQSSSSRCYAFTRSGNGVAVSGSFLAPPGRVAQRVVSQFAHAASPRDITVTTILETRVPPIRSTVTETWSFKLDTGGARIVFSRTMRIADTTLDFTPVTTITVRYGGNQHRAAPGELEAFQAYQSNQHSIGGSNVGVPGAK
jgi:hypothetical protein